MLYILSHILGSERLSYFSIAGLKSFGYLSYGHPWAHYLGGYQN
jgi:hypothetical protein